MVAAGSDALAGPLGMVSLVRAATDKALYSVLNAELQ